MQTVTQEGSIIPIPTSEMEAVIPRESVTELTDLLIGLYPNSREFGDDRRRIIGLMAMLAILSGANPLPMVGDMHLMRIRGKPVLDFHIKFYRRKAMEQDHIAWYDEPRMMTEQERIENAVPDDAVYAAICSGSRETHIAKFTKIGASFNEGYKISRRTGIGYITQDELTQRDGTRKKPPKGKSFQWVANKRAEKDFYRAQDLLYTVQAPQAGFSKDNINTQIARWGITNPKDETPRYSDGTAIKNDPNRYKNDTEDANDIFFN